MGSNNGTSLEHRLSRAAEAKRAMLAKFKRAQDPNNPEAVEKRKQREAIVAARTARAIQRETARQEHERELTSQAALAEEAAAKAAREAERAAAEQAARDIIAQAERQAAIEAEQKAKRDARYAARKAAQKRRRRGY